MIASMTGFGRGESAEQGFGATVELRSVNSRYCEVSVRMPRSLSERESDVQRIVKAAFARGRISVQIQLENAAEAGLDLMVDEDLARSYRKLIERLRDSAGIEEPVQLEHLLRFSDVFKPVEAEENRADHAWTVVESALERACSSMKEMRLREGEALDLELMERLDSIEVKLAEIEKQAPLRLPRAKDRLYDRLSEVLEDDRIDNDRLEFEMALLADRLDIREECVRLKSHLNVFREAVENSLPVGRKLNFLSQEMNREINTIGSKANDADLSHIVVGMKEELEKIREQIENVE